MANAVRNAVKRRFARLAMARRNKYISNLCGDGGAIEFGQRQAAVEQRRQALVMADEQQAGAGLAAFGEQQAQEGFTRVGIQGRIILGPAGGPGQIDLPIRLAVVHEGPEPKTIFTKLNRVPVTVPDGDSNVQFTSIEEDLTFPMPRTAGLIDEYVVYIGFDPQGFREPPKKRPERAPPKRRPPA